MKRRKGQMAEEKARNTKVDKETKKEIKTTKMNGHAVERSTCEIGGPWKMLHNILRA